MVLSDRLLWVWLSLACGAGSKVYNQLFASFSTLREIYEATPERLAEVEGIDRGTVYALSDKSTKTAERIMAECLRDGWGILTYGDKIYPRRLKTLKNPPVVLYVRGNLLDLNDAVCISVVGTRSMTEYGERQAYRLSYALACGGAVIVSGMALGCDSMAANGALDAHAPTVAVLGSGIDVIYPRQHKVLAGHIERGGMIITEYPPGTAPLGEHFPVRNRIISGLSQGTLVVEAPLHSGALITASTAVSQGRDLFAVPGEVGRENSAGCNELIKNGARAVTSAADILGVYEFVYPHRINVDAALDAERDPSVGSGHESASRRLIASRLSRDDRRAEKRAKKETREHMSEKKKDRDGSFSFEADRQIREPEAAPAKIDVAAVRETLTGSQLAVFDAMGDGEITPDEIAACGISLPEIMSALTLLELSGCVTALPGGRYRRGT